MTTVALFTSLLASRGQSATIHIEQNAQSCPCRTPEGYRDPIWHQQNPNAPECNDAGFLFDAVNYTVQCLIVPVAPRGPIDYITEMFGEIRKDDHVGVFPATLPDGTALDFSNWSPAGDSYVACAGKQYTVVGFTLVPDPGIWSVNHHWEVALRNMNLTRDF